MSQDSRLRIGGLIDRARPLSFSFDGKTYQGYAGDTVASALLANGVRVFGRSFKYHRPRGILSAGAEEPNALITVGEGAKREPNSKATIVELREGLVCASQNRWPSLSFDVGAVNDLMSAFLPAGFYYKTFMGPPLDWMFFEHFIRKAAGMGSASTEPDSNHYDKQHAHCDVLVVGAGPAGVAAAIAAADSGARVIVTEQDWRLGAGLLGETIVRGEQASQDWCAQNAQALAHHDNVRVMLRATAFGYYDHNLIAVAQHLAPGEHGASQRLWLIRAKSVVIATGATEQPLVFARNDRPGVMLAGAVSTYVNRFAVLPGKRAVVFSNNDSAYRTALDLRAAGAEVAAIVDTRAQPAGPNYQIARGAGIEMLAGAAIVATHGAPVLSAVTVSNLGGASQSGVRLECDVLAMSGGWSPNLHLHCQAGGTTKFDAAQFCYVPDQARQNNRSAGAAAGLCSLSTALQDGWRAGVDAAADCGFRTRSTVPFVTALHESTPVQASPYFGCVGGGKKFVDFQSDVTTSDIEIAAREGMHSVEHLKRYTTLGMGTDQGKTSNLAGAAILAACIDHGASPTGQTRFRPPYTPVSIGLFAHREIGRHYQPIRRTAMHSWHEQAGAMFVEAGLWLRPRAYPKPGETLTQAIRREARHVREIGGIVDVSTLGKIEIVGPDVLEFLSRVYVNAWKNLEVGKVRYGLMLREDGLAYDDGTSARLDAERVVMTTTTANAAKVLQNLEFFSQVVWPELDVAMCSVTEQWAVFAVAGPRARDVLAALAPTHDVSNAAFPFMACREMTIAGRAGRVFRISYSGELAYEIAVPCEHGLEVWEAAVAAGAKIGVYPYGTEAMGVLRIEKGHPAGPELDGRSTADDLGLSAIVSKKKPFIGSALMQREALKNTERPRLVGLVPADGASALRAGSHIAEHSSADGASTIGHISSACFSPNLSTPIALAFVKGGRAREGSEVYALSPLHNECVRARVVSPVFVDPEGTRLHG